MNLAQLKKGDIAIIIKLNCDNDLKKRLYSFGIIESEDISIGAVSLAKQTIEMIVDNTSIAIRLDEAKLIEVKKG